MMRLKSKLLSLNANKADKVKVFSPRNCEELRIPFKTDKTAKVVGKLASIPQPMKAPADDSEEPQLITGVLVQNDFKMSLMAPEDLREYAGLTTTTIACKQRLKLSAAGVDLIKWGLEGTFGSIEELPEAKQPQKNGANGDGADNDTKMEDADEEFPIDQVVAAYLVMGCVTVRYRTSGEVELEWEGNMLNDGIADAVMAVLLGIESSPAAVKRKPTFPSPYSRRTFYLTNNSLLSSRLRKQALPLPRPRLHRRRHPHPPAPQPPRHSLPRRTPRAPNDVPRSTIRRRQRLAHRRAQAPAPIPHTHQQKAHRQKRPRKRRQRRWRRLLHGRVLRRRGNHHQHQQQ